MLPLDIFFHASFLYLYVRDYYIFSKITLASLTDFYEYNLEESIYLFGIVPITRANSYQLFVCFKNKASLLFFIFTRILQEWD